ncbi:MAG: hypothetical protein GY865_03580 [candidate division Zixibacteria bacterium]|nr:hypothetical protein [candidate division Zixibacteria bacterium]
MSISESCIAKAIIFAAKECPWINSTFEGDNLHVKKYFNIGMAVVRDNSLIVPVIKHCEQKIVIADRQRYTRNGEIVIRPILIFSMSFDYRVVDGGYAVQFLRRMIEFLEDPDSWVLGVV